MKQNKKSMYRNIVANLRKHGAKKIAVFGSVARSENRTGSDIDVLVDFSKKKGLLELIRIERQLSEQLNTQVDLVTYNSLSPHIKNNVYNDLEVIYG